MTSPTDSKSSRSASGRRLTERLSLEDWTASALDLLMREGVSSVKISRLCSELKVTKGSFYWHFDNIAELFEAVADRWCELTRVALEALSQLEGLPASERLQLMTDRLMDDQSSMVERALRDWARSDPRIATVVAETDARIFEVVERALLDHGLDADKARVRAGLLVYAGIGFAHGPEGLPRPTREEVGHVLALMTENS